VIAKSLACPPMKLWVLNKQAPASWYSRRALEDRRPISPVLLAAFSESRHRLHPD
jgi:hypothetical protein